MIYIGKIEDMNSQNYDERLMIVRSPDEIPAHARHVPALSPTVQLFKKYRAALHAGEFNKAWFDKIYVPQFIMELSHNREAQSVLKELCDAGKQKDFFLCCYCEDESLCHRSIIAGVLLGMGAPISTRAEYIKYYEMLKATGSDFAELLK